MTGDVVTPADQGTARRLDSRIRLMAGAVRDGLEKIAALIEQAKTGQIHLTLGFPSWTAYLADALGGNLAVDASIRQELVCYLSGEGMSQRAIVAATGASKGTVSRNLAGAPSGAPDLEPGEVDSQAKSTGMDGKSYPAKAPAKKAPAKKTTPKLTTVKDDVTPEPVDLDVISDETLSHEWVRINEILRHLDQAERKFACIQVNTPVGTKAQREAAWAELDEPWADWLARIQRCTPRWPSAFVMCEQAEQRVRAAGRLAGDGLSCRPYETTEGGEKQ